MRRKEGSSKQGQTNSKAKQHSTPKAVTFSKKIELPCDILYNYRSKKSRKESVISNVDTDSDDESSEEEEGEGEGEEGEGVWVEKKVQQEREGVYVGPVQEIKVQAVSAKKE